MTEADMKYVKDYVGLEIERVRLDMRSEMVHYQGETLDYMNARLDLLEDKLTRTFTVETEMAVRQVEARVSEEMHLLNAKLLERIEELENKVG